MTNGLHLLFFASVFLSIVSVVKGNLDSRQILFIHVATLILIVGLQG